MENKNNMIIAILVIVAVILAAAMVAYAFPSLTAKQDSKIVLTGNETLYKGDNISMKLTDLNKTPIENGAIDVSVADKDGKIILNESVTTNSKGKANVNLDLDPGKYTVNATFRGNDNFTGNTTSKKITIKEIVEEPVKQTTTSSSSSGQSSQNDVVDSRDFESWDYAPGVHVHENTYSNGDIEHYYDDGSYDYYDSSAQEWRYKNSDGSSGSMYVGN